MAFFAPFRPRPFLTEQERAQVAAGLAEAQRYTAAPIGLVVEQRAADVPAVRARRLFLDWEVADAERERAVLLYARETPPGFAVEAGPAFHRAAPPAFWDAVERDLRRHFEERRYCDGLFKALAQIALQLESLYPPRENVQRTT